MMKNRLKSIVLAIAVFEIVMVNNIRFGSFVGIASPWENRVDARPPFSRDGSVIDIQAAPVIRRNYSAGFFYMVQFDAYRASDTIWNEGAKGLIEQKIREAISGRQIRPGVNIYGETINLDSFKLVTFAFDPIGKDGWLGIDVPVNMQFKISNRSVLGSYADSTFRTKLNLQIMLKSSVKNNRVTVDNIDVKMNPDLIGSNVGDSRMLSSVDNFLKGEFKQDVESRNRTAAVKAQWAGYIKAAIDRFTPANILNQ